MIIAPIVAVATIIPLMILGIVFNQPEIDQSDKIRITEVNMLVPQKDQYGTPLVTSNESILFTVTLEKDEKIETDDVLLKSFTSNSELSQYIMIDKPTVRPAILQASLEEFLDYKGDIREQTIEDEKNTMIIPIKFTVINVPSGNFHETLNTVLYINDKEIDSYSLDIILANSVESIKYSEDN